MIGPSPPSASRFLSTLLRRLAVVAAAAFFAGPAAGEDSDRAKPAAAAVPRVDEVKPEIFYLENDAGQLVPVPGFRYRDFVELLRMKEGLPGPARPPAAVLENLILKVDLTASDPDVAGTCPVTVECTIRQTRGGWVSVPLGFGGLLLSAPPRHEGPGRLLVDAATDGGGYRAWFDAAAQAGEDARHTVTLQGRIPLDATPALESFAVDLPPATASALEILSTRRDPVVTAVPAAPTQRVEPAGAQGSVVSLGGLAGKTRIRLAGRDAAAGAGDPAVSQAFVESIVRIDGRNAVTEATIRVEGLAADAAAVRINLPPGAIVRSVRSPSALVARGGDAGKPHVDVSIVRGADAKAVVELECERPLDRTADAKEAVPFEAVGFAVEGVEPWRQWGRVSLVVEGDWQAVWSDGLRRVDPPAAARGAGLVAAFAYDAQPASLKVRVRPRRSRVVIEPEYRYDVAAERIAFEARLRVAATGAPATEIVVDVDSSWAIDEVGPPSVVDAAGVTTEGGRIVIPFAQGLSGDAVIEIRGGRTIDRAAEKLDWRMPVPGPGLVGPATVIVSSDSDIELLPDTDRIKGLVRQTAAALPQSDGDRVVLAYRLDVKQGEFFAARRFLQRRVDATISVQAEMDETSTSVEETIRLDVVHVPLEFIELLVPALVAESGSFEVRQGERLLDPVEVADADDGDDSTEGGQGTRRMRAILPQQLLGAGELTVRYKLPTPALPSETTVVDDLPLVLPVVTRIGRQSFVLAASDRISIDMRGDGWRREPGPQTAVASRVWSTTRQQATVPLAVSARRQAAAGGAVVEAAWLQTTLLPDRREDAFTYAISGVADRIAVVLPTWAGVEGTTDIRVDGQSVAASVRPDRSLTIELPRGDAPGRWLLEIRAATRRTDAWGFPSRLGMPGPVKLEPPVFEQGVAQRRFYWEICSQPDEYLFGAPLSWTSQQRWQWGPLGPDRLPVVSRRVLAAWVDIAGSRTAADPLGPLTVAVVDRPEPPRRERRAVYSGVGNPGPAAPWLLPFWFVVLLASGSALAVGLGCVYRAAFRSTAAVLAVGGCVAVAAAAFPDAAPLTVLAAAPGAGLALVAWGLRRFVERDGVGRGVSGGPAAVSASSLTRARIPAPSLIVANSSLRTNSVTPPGRSAP
jgi:hypothetical protein